MNFSSSSNEVAFESPSPLDIVNYEPSSDHHMDEHGSIMEDGAVSNEISAGDSSVETPNSHHVSLEQLAALSSTRDEADDDDDREDSSFAAVQALTESDTLEDPPMICQICNKNDDRPVLRFLPVETDMSVVAAAPNVQTFGQDICLHVFCGKTASILPTVNQPELEILTKAGIKNKHGIGQEVNAALARTRGAILAEHGNKEKHFYLVREFEANLAAVRDSHILYSTDSHSFATASSLLHSSSSHRRGNHDSSPTLEQLEAIIMVNATSPSQQRPITKVLPIKAAARGGKVHCECGGKHLPTNTTNGIQSWRNHVLTKRHQKYMEKRGLHGAV